MSLYGQKLREGKLSEVPDEQRQQLLEEAIIEGDANEKTGHLNRAVGKIVLDELRIFEKEKLLAVESEKRVEEARKYVNNRQAYWKELGLSLPENELQRGAKDLMKLLKGAAMAESTTSTTNETTSNSSPIKTTN